MNTRELLELSAMDVLGLLDESERDAFERALRAASPEVQAAVRAEQLRVAKDDELLPRVSPPPGVKARVMSALSEAIASVAGQESTAGYVGLARRPGGVVASATLWRAACLGFATAAVVMGAFVFQVSKLNRQTIAQIEQNQASDQIRSLGTNVMGMLTNPAMFNAHFAPIAQDSKDTRATIYVDREKQEAYLLCSDLPPGEYRLVIQRAATGSSDQVAFQQTGNSLKVVYVKQIDPNDVNGLSIVVDRGPRAAASTVMRIGDGA